MPRFPSGLFSISLPIQVLKRFLLPSILATLPDHLYLIDLISLAVIVAQHKS